MTTVIEHWLLDALGRRVEQVQGGVYVGHQPAGDESPISIWVQFAETTCVRLFGMSDGWGLGLDESPPAEINMGPAGRIVTQDMAKMRPFVQCMGSPLQGAAFFTSVGSVEPVGVRLSFEQGEVFILNWGDELLVDNRPPRDAVPGELIVCSVEKTA